MSHLQLKFSFVELPAIINTWSTNMPILLSFKSVLSCIAYRPSDFENYDIK